MSAAPVLLCRRAIVAALKADPALTALVPSGQIFGEKSRSDAWPFIRCSEFEGEPFYRVIGNIHGFSRAPFADEAHDIAARVAEAIDGAVVDLADGRKAYIDVTATRLLPDPEESTAWHSICTVSIEIPKGCTET